MNNDGPKSRTFSLLRTLSSTALKAGQEALKSKLEKFEKSEKRNPDDTSKQSDFFGKAGVIDFAPSAAALRLVRGLDELKGAAMKLGQMLSLSDDDMLPQGWKQALGKLQAEATPRSWEFIEPLIVKNLGSLDAFETIDKVALHAASIGQVHRATLKDGRAVAVKVRYPGLEKNVHSDLQNIRLMLRLANVLPTKGNFDDIFAQVERIFLQEMDFDKEHQFYEHYSSLFEGHPSFVVPKVIASCSNSAILTTTWIEGVHLSTFIDTHKAEFDVPGPVELRDRVGSHFVDLLFTELFDFQTIQSDPNPANFLVTPDGRIGLLDFGATDVLSDTLTQNYWRLSLACLNGTKTDVIKVGLEMGLVLSSDSVEAQDSFVRMMTLTAEPFQHHSYEWRNCGLSKRLRDEVMRFSAATRLRPPPSEILFLNRRILGGQLLLEKLGPTVRARELLITRKNPRV